MEDIKNPTPVLIVSGIDREIIARFIAEDWASRPTSGGLTADYYMSVGTPHVQADKLIERLSCAALSATATEGQP